MRIPLLLAWIGGILLAPGETRAEVLVVAVKGEVHGGGKLLQAGDRLQWDATVALESRDAEAQLLVGRRLSVWLSRRAMARFHVRGDDLRLEQGIARVAGRGVVVTRHLRLDLDGTAVLGDRQVHLVRGRAQAVGLRARPGGERVDLEPGQVAQVTPGGALRLGSRVSARLEGAADRYVAPPPWRPALGEVDLGGQVRRVRQRVERQRDREREMASCGCTEGTGPGAGPVRGPDSLDSLERRQTRVRVHITGMPKKL